MGVNQKREEQREKNLQAERRKVETNLQIIDEMEALRRSVDELSRAVNRMREDVPREAEKAARRAAFSARPDMTIPILAPLVGSAICTAILWHCIDSKAGNIWMLVDKVRQALGA